MGLWMSVPRGTQFENFPHACTCTAARELLAQLMEDHRVLLRTYHFAYHGYRNQPEECKKPTCVKSLTINARFEPGGE